MVSTVPLETAQKPQRNYFACFAVILLVIAGFTFFNRNSLSLNPSDPHVISHLVKEIEALKASEKAHQDQIYQLSKQLDNSQKQFRVLQEMLKLKEGGQTSSEMEGNVRQLSVQREEADHNKALDDEFYESQQMYENVESRMSSYVTMENLASVVEYYEEKFEEITRELDEQKKSIRESREDSDILSSYDEEDEKKEAKEPLEKVKTWVRATEKKLDKIQEIMIEQAGEVKEASKKLGKEAEKEAHKLLKKAQGLKDSIVHVFHH